jgi:hypothetical protein
MAMIPTRIHGALDYAGGLILLTGRGPLASSDPRGQAILRAAGAGMLATGAITDHELGIRRLLPMPIHLAGDAALGALLLSAPFTLRKGGRLSAWLPHAILGAGAIAAAALTDRAPADAPGAQGEAGADPLPPAPQATSTAGPAARVAPGETGVQVAPAPPETPGPSVTPPATPESDTERAEWADSGRPDPTATPDDAILVAQEEAAAAAEAAAIGGRAPHDVDDPALDPVYQAGGGEQEGWEAAERELIENAEHGDGRANPLLDAPTGELESDRSTAVYGEADHVEATEVVRDPATSGEDPGAGPGVASDR